MPRVLIFTQQQGSTKSLIPVYQQLVKRGYDVSIYAQGDDHAIKVLKEANISNYNVFKGGASGEAEIRTIFEMCKPDIVLTGATPDMKDKEGNTIVGVEKLARELSSKLSKPHLNLVDTAGQVKERFEFKGSLYKDSILLLPDENTLEEYVQNGFRIKRIAVIGNPAYDELVNGGKKDSRKKVLDALKLDDKKTVLLALSGSDYADRTLGVKDGNITCLDALLEGASKGFEKPNVIVQIHPRDSGDEKYVKTLSDKMQKYDSKRGVLITDPKKYSVSIDELVNAADLNAINLSTTADRAILTGKTVVVLQPGGTPEKDPLTLTNEGYAPVAYTAEKCAQLVYGALNDETFRKQIEAMHNEFRKLLINNGKSAERAISVIEILIKQYMKA